MVRSMPVVQEIIMQQGSSHHLPPVHMDSEAVRKQQTVLRHLIAMLPHRHIAMLNIPSGSNKLL